MEKKEKKTVFKNKKSIFDFAGGDPHLEEILYAIPDMQEVTVEVPCWKLAVVLNDQLMFQGDNPLGFDGCPFVPVFWNYEPHNNYYDLRCRGLVRTMRDSNYLLNRRIIINHDISEATINQGWIRKIGAVANEDNLKKSGQGWDIIVNDGYELTDIQKIIPSAVPESDMALADQLQSLIFSTSGVNLETWSAQDQSNASSLTVMLKQAANLMVLQKYFDQWDVSLKLLGERMLQIVLHNWNAAKVGLILGEEPSPHFYSQIFAKFQTIVEEGLLTSTQKQQEFKAILDLNEILGGIIPSSYIASKATIQGKNDLMQLLQEQEQKQAAVQQEATNIQHAFEEARLKELISKAANNLAMARERHGRSEADIGLFEERLSEITHNRAMATKAKMEALEKMVDVIAKYGEIETSLKMHQLDTLDYKQEANEDREKIDAKRTAMSNDFVMQLMDNAS